MTTEAHLWNAPRPSARQPRPGERIWSLWKHARRIDCELRTFESGAEVQLFVDSGFYAGRRHVSQELALRAAEKLRARLNHAGWTPLVSGRPVGGAGAHPPLATREASASLARVRPQFVCG